MENFNFKFMGIKKPEQLGVISSESDNNKVANSSEEVSTPVEETKQAVGDIIEQTESPEEKLKKYQVLHLDDDTTILRATSRILSKTVLKSQSFTTAEELIEAIKNSDIPTIVISDNSFGGYTDGVNLAEETYEIRKEKSIPFILACTPPGGERYEKFKTQFDKVMANGQLDAFVEKPLGISTIKAVLYKVVK